MAQVLEYFGRREENRGVDGLAKTVGGRGKAHMEISPSVLKAQITVRQAVFTLFHKY